MRKIGIYVDGSAPINVASATNPAGWGVVIVEDPKNHEGGEILASYAGPVITDPDEISHLGAEVGSNNTAELSAIWWGLYIMRALSLLGDVEVTIYGDSEYAGKMANGSWKPKENKELVRNVKGMWQTTLLNCNSLVWAHVRAHQGNYYNEMADELANRGVHIQEDHKSIDIDM